MKVVITGAGSYIGSFIIQELTQKGHDVVELDMKTEKWREYDFHHVDSIVHVAAIVHVNEKEIDSTLYKKINCDLTYEVAKKAKESGVKQFVFLSTMGVYGITHSKDYITTQTPISPKSAYAKSKAEAEHRIIELVDNGFKICILRPPLVCGKDSPGNMTKLINLVRKVHVFPMIYNERSYIDASELGIYILECIEQGKYGVLFPQHKDYMCTSTYIKEYAQKNNIKVLFTSCFNPLIKLLLGRVKTIDKVFGDLKYERK